MKALLNWVSRRHLLQEGPRALLTVAGVALGVAMFVSIRLASTSALASFSDTVDAVAGRSNLQVSADADGFDEALFPLVRTVPGVEAAAPVLQFHVAARAGAPLVRGSEGVEPDRRAGYDETLLVLGLDVFREGPFVRYAEREGGDANASPLDWLADARGIAVTRALADRHGLRDGDTLTVLAGGRPEVLRVRSILASQSFEQAFGGNVIVLDLGVAQTVFNRIGRLDRIDLIADPARIDAVSDSLRARLPGHVNVGTPAGRTRQVENMVRAFALNLTALSFIALFVSGFLIFNAVSMAVLRRRRELAVLRAVGATRRQVVTMVLGEGLVLGMAGSGLGLLLGTAFARTALGAVSRTLTDLYLMRHAEQLVLDGPTYVAGFLVGLAVALFAALAPALEASYTRPALTLRQGSLIEARRLPVARWGALGLALLVFATLVAYWTVHAGRPVGGFVSAFLVVAAFACLTPGIALLIETAAGPLLQRMAGIEAALGARYLREAVARTSVVIAAIMVSVGMLVALTIMVGSFRRTVDVWIGQSIRGDLYVEPVGHRLSLSATVLPPDLVNDTRRLPGVRAVDTFRGTRVPLGERVVFVAGVDFGVQAEYGGLDFLEGRTPDVLTRARANDEVIVTESFHHHMRVSAGDTLELATPSGRVRLPVAGVYYDYTSDAGAVLMDMALYARLWQDTRTESMALYLEPGADAGDVRRRLLERAGSELVLHAIPNQQLRARVLTVFDQTFQITWALQAIAIVVAVLGVIAALTTMILQRAREIGVLRAAGALRSQVRTMVFAESGLIGLVGGLLGCLAGFALALVLVHVINRQFFGWSIHMHVEPGVFAQAIGLMVLTALVAGIAPARLAASRLPAAAMRME